MYTSLYTLLNENVYKRRVMLKDKSHLEYLPPRTAARDKSLGWENKPEIPELNSENFPDEYNATLRGLRFRKGYIRLRYVCQTPPNGKSILDTLQGLPQSDALYKEYVALKIKDLQRMGLTRSDLAAYANEIKETDPSEHWSNIVREYTNVIKSLIKYYEDLDEEIVRNENDAYGQGITNKYFNYNGYSILYRYMKYGNKINVVDAEHNEYSRWLHILDKLSDSELRQLHNPFIQHMVMDYIFKHPFNGIVMDYTLTGRTNYMLSMQTQMLKDRFDSAREWHKKHLDTHQLLPFDKMITIASKGFEDGYELESALRMYYFALRYASIYTKYPKAATISGFANFIGLGALGKNFGNDSLLARRKRYVEKLEEIKYALEHEYDKYDEQGMIPHLERLYESYVKSIETQHTLSRKIGTTGEEILLNPHASNSQGAKHMLQYLESGSHIEIAPEVEKQEIVISFGDVDYEA
jgi:hypothetical protein